MLRIADSLRALLRTVNRKFITTILLTAWTITSAPQALSSSRPSVEAIAEVRTDVNLYNAEVGRTGGAVINVITKSGVNQIHGSAYEFFRNDITDSRNFFISPTLHKPELRQNQFGGSLSGPD